MPTFSKYARSRLRISAPGLHPLPTPITMASIFSVMKNIPLAQPPAPTTLRPSFALTFGAYALVWILAVLVALYFRSYPLRHFYSTESYEKASLLAINQLRASVAEQIITHSPQLPEAIRDQTIKKEFDRRMHTESKSLLQRIERLAVQIEKAQPGPQRYPYLLEADPFNYYNLTDNLLSTGRLSDSQSGSKYLNRLMLAPEGHWEPLTLHPYVGLTIYHVLKFFRPETELMYAVSFTPLIITAFFLLAFVWTGWLLNFRPMTTLAGAMLLACCPLLIKRSLFGWYDNDPYSLLFPLLVCLPLLLAFRDGSNPRGRLFSGFIAGLIMNLYALFWHGWMFHFTIITLTLIILSGLNLWLVPVTQRRKGFWLIWPAFALGTFLGIAVTFGPTQFFALFSEGLKALKDFMNPQLSIWPDIYVTVGELKRMTLADLIELSGGGWILILGAFGAGLVAIKFFSSREKSNYFGIILFFALATSAFLLTLGAQRFALLFLTPLVLLICFGLEELTHWLESKFPFPQNKQNSFSWFKLSLGSIPLLLMIPAVIHAQVTTPSQITRIYNRTWDNAFQKINQATPQDAIVNSWWPPGHFIKAMAKRRVTFDGATINFPQAYWMANVFLATDEREALGILRMLNNSANAACDYLVSLGAKTSVAVELLKVIGGLNPFQAQLFLNNASFPPEQSRALLKLTHAAPPPAYLFIYNEIVEKSLILSFLDRWNFKKVEEINAHPATRAKLPSRKSKEYIDFLWNLAGGPLHYSEPLHAVGLSGDTVLFDQGVAINLSTKRCEIRSPKFGQGIPAAIQYLDEQGQYVEAKIPGNTLGYNVLLLDDNGRLSVILADPRLARSVLFRLYYFKGQGLKFFKPFFADSDLTGRTQILVYEINWNNFRQELDGPLTSREN